jgi:hypothetical protein
MFCYVRYCHVRGTRCRSWLKHCVTNRKVAGSIPDGVIGIFRWPNSSERTTQTLTETSTRNISWGAKSGRCVGLTTLPPPCADCLEIWKPQPPGTLRACRGLYWDRFIFTGIYSSYLTWVLRCKFLISYTCHPDTIFTWAGMWGSVVIFRSQKGSASKKI